jgi:2-dehydro-3-deoxyphosphooctonate aldolase (KDO 8-P synthase)
VRQTNFIQNVCKQGIPVNIKKGQFQAPWDMGNVVAKAREVGNQQITVCDRGTSFGYNKPLKLLVLVRLALSYEDL